MYVCGFDTSNIHQYIFEYVYSLCIVAAVVIHTEGAPLLLPVSIQVSPGPKQPLGRGLRLVMYRFVSFSIEESRYSRMY